MKSPWESLRASTHRNPSVSVLLTGIADRLQMAARHNPSELPGLIADLRDAIQPLTDATSIHPDERINTVMVDLSKLAADIDALSTNVTSAVAQLGALTTDIVALKAQIATLTPDPAVQAAVDALDVKVSGISLTLTAAEAANPA